MYSAKSFCEIKLLHLLAFVIFAYLVKIQRIFFGVFIAMTNDCEITQKKNKE